MLPPREKIFRNVSPSYTGMLQNIQFLIKAFFRKPHSLTEVNMYWSYINRKTKRVRLSPKSKFMNNNLFLQQQRRIANMVKFYLNLPQVAEFGEWSCTRGKTLLRDAEPHTRNNDAVSTPFLQNHGRIPRNRSRNCKQQTVTEATRGAGQGIMMMIIIIMLSLIVPFRTKWEVDAFKSKSKNRHWSSDLMEFKNINIGNIGCSWFRMISLSWESPYCIL